MWLLLKGPPDDPGQDGDHWDPDTAESPDTAGGEPGGLYAGLLWGPKHQGRIARAAASKAWDAGMLGAIFGGFLSHRATPESSSFIFRTMGFSITKTNQLLGIPHDYGKPH